jgi:hypothetical protein
MSITIDQESRQRIRIPFDIDNMCARYKTDSEIYVFPSFSLWTIQKNLFYLLRNSVLVEFDPKYKYRPDYMSYDEYGTVSLSYLLMYINSVDCIEDFDLNSVIIPSLSSIVDICKDKFPKLDVINLEGVNF